MIKFTILTCDKYIDIRCIAQEQTFLKSQNYLFLTDTFVGENIISYNTLQTYEAIQEKYITFFKNYIFDMDYYFFIDDDTYVNINKIKNIKFDKNVCIGHLMILNSDGTDKNGNQTGYPMEKISGENTYLPLTYVSGGAGFILSKEICNKIKEYLKNSNNIPKSGHGDVSIGFWLRNIGIEIKHDKRFYDNVPSHIYEHREFNRDDEYDAITYHYVSPEDMQNYYEKYK